MDSLDKKILLLILIFICLVGCSEKKTITKTQCPYCLEFRNDLPMHKSGIMIEDKFYLTCWSELRKAVREGIKNDKIKYEKETDNGKRVK